MEIMTILPPPGVAMGGVLVAQVSNNVVNPLNSCMTYNGQLDIYMCQFLIAGCGNGGCNGGGGQAEEPSFGGIQPRKGEKCFCQKS